MPKPVASHHGRCHSVVTQAGYQSHVLELRCLSKTFGAARAVNDVSFAVREGEMTAIIGASGAGKTTLLRMINRLTEPDSGDISWRGESVVRLRGRHLRGWRKRCAMIFQSFNLSPRLDVLTNVLVGTLHDRPLGAAMFKSFPRAVRARAILELDALGLAHVALQRAETLSGGQQQRVAIARAMMQDPEILLADEPIASLDPANAAIVMEALAQINRTRGITVLVNLHSLDAVRRWCPRAIGMSGGKVVFDEAPAQLDDAVLDSLYGAARRLGGDVATLATAS